MNVLNEKGLESILDPDNLQAAYRKVKANKGVPGVDGISVDELNVHLKKHWPAIEQKIRAGTYQPGLLLPAVLPKPGGGERHLSIPNTQDRMIQQAIAQPLGKVFEPLFSEHSYGYRPGRSAHDAVKIMKHYVVETKRRVVVDVDIQGFFDEVNHDILMHLVSQQIKDKPTLKLIGSYLRCGKLVNNRKVPHNGKGIPQGGPLSPLLGNIYLTPLDEQLEEWGVCFARYADDLVLFTQNQEEAEALLERVSEWIERKLKLKVNRDKSGTRAPHEGNFLSYRIEKDGRLALSKKAIRKFKANVRDLLCAQKPRKWEELIKEWKAYVRGWWEYAKLTEWYEAQDLSRWCRRHIRKLCWLRWHNWKGRRNAFKRLGASPYHQRTAHSSRGAWRMAACPSMQTILNNQRLRDWGFITPEDLAKVA